MSAQIFLRGVRAGGLALVLLTPASLVLAAQSAMSHVAETKQIVFAEFETTITVQSDGFEEYGWFTLGAESDGVDLRTQDIRLSIGTFTVTIPAGSLRPISGRGSASFTFEGTIAGTWMDVTLSRIEDKSFELRVEGRGEPAMEIVRPEFVTLTIGANIGSLISAQVEKEV